jgi:hypothetical protein
MAGRGWLPAVGGAALAALLFALWPKERATTPGLDAETEAEIGAWRRETAARLDALERRLDALADRLGPPLAAAPVAPSPSPSASGAAPPATGGPPPTDGARPPAPGPDAAASAPVPPAVSPDAVFFSRLQAGTQRRLDPERERRLAELAALLEEDALGAASRLRGMLARDAERGAAVEFLGSSSNPDLLPVVREAISDAMREGRRGDVPGLVNASARMKSGGSLWTAKQATGEPDTPIGGDLGTAWASKTGDMGEVWLELSYDRAVRADAVRVFESFHPGAVAKVLAKAPDGTWDVVWEGREAPGEAPWTSEIRLAARSYATGTIRLVLDTDRVAGWNEIDAVELVGDGWRQWAKEASASSTYGL